MLVPDGNVIAPQLTRTEFTVKTFLKIKLCKRYEEISLSKVIREIRKLVFGNDNYFKYKEDIVSNFKNSPVNYIKILNKNYFENVPELTNNTRSFILFYDGGQNSVPQNPFGSNEWVSGTDRVIVDLWNSDELDLNYALTQYYRNINNFKPSKLPTLLFKIFSSVDSDKYIDYNMTYNDTLQINFYNVPISYGQVGVSPVIIATFTYPVTTKPLNINQFLDLVNSRLKLVGIDFLIEFDWTFYPYTVQYLDGRTVILKSVLMKVINKSEYYIKLVGPWNLIQFFGKPLGAMTASTMMCMCGDNCKCTPDNKCCPSCNCNISVAKLDNINNVKNKKKCCCTTTTTTSTTTNSKKSCSSNKVENIESKKCCGDKTVDNKTTTINNKSNNNDSIIIDRKSCNNDILNKITANCKCEIVDISTDTNNTNDPKICANEKCKCVGCICVNCMCGMDCAEMFPGNFNMCIQKIFPTYATLDPNNPIMMMDTNNAELIVNPFSTYLGPVDGFENDNLMNFAVRLNSSEKWIYHNMDVGISSHPMHFHLSSGFSDFNPRYNPEYNQRYYSMDVYGIGPQQTIDWWLKFTNHASEDANNLGYMMHCHIQKHITMNMMGQYYVFKDYYDYF